MATAIEVTDEPLVVETQRASQADTVSQRYIADLPIGRRDYLTFTLLMPGVSNSNTIADNAVLGLSRRASFSSHLSTRRS